MEKRAHGAEGAATARGHTDRARLAAPKAHDFEQEARILSDIIAGTFEQAEQAEAARARLESQGIAPDQVCIFYVSPPGRRAEFPIGGDENKSAGSRDADHGAAKGAALGGAVGVGVGLLATPFIGPAGVVAGVSAASLVGAVAGGVGNMGEEQQTENAPAADPATSGVNPAGSHSQAQDAPAQRPSGMLLAVNSVDRSSREIAIRVLREAGASGIEHAEGQWDGGRWADFEPGRPPSIIGPGPGPSAS
jgi:hypothetical protein